MQYILKDINGNALLTCKLPEGFETAASIQLKQYPSNQIVHVEAQVQKGGCRLGYMTGESYAYEKKKVQQLFYMQPQQQPQSDSGAWYSTPVSITDELDSVAASILGKKTEAAGYYDLSEAVKAKAKTEFNRIYNNFIEELRAAMSISTISVMNTIRNCLLDGGTGIYEDEGRILAVCLFRTGIEIDTNVGPMGVYENMTNEPFGYADTSTAEISSAYWSVPFIVYMITDSKEDLQVFSGFADSLEQTEQLKNYIEQVRIQVQQRSMQQAQINNMQTQAMINNAFAMQQQQFAAMDRLSSSLHQDLDNFHNNLFNTMAQNDRRIDTGPSYGETYDDRIQRKRHESIMGVDTYDRNDGTTVEYSTMADRVFESNLDSTTHFGTHNYFDSYVPEGWHELPKKQ